MQKVKKNKGKMDPMKQKKRLKPTLRESASIIHKRDILIRRISSIMYSMDDNNDTI